MTETLTLYWPGVRLERHPDSAPAIRFLFDAMDAATRPTFTGKIVVEVEFGKVKRLTTVEQRLGPDSPEFEAVSRSKVGLWAACHVA